MKKRLLAASAALVGLGAPLAHAQVDLPQPSPSAKVMQTVGLTEIEVEYSSPGKKGRTVWGELVPYGQHWRAGANLNTLVRFSGPVTIGGETLEAGTYSLHTFPEAEVWTVVVNRKTDGYEVATYDESQDVARFEVKPMKGPDRERLTYLFSDTTRSTTNLDLEWAGLRLRIPIAVDTDAQVDAAVDRAMDRLWRTPAFAAMDLLRQGRDLERALGLADRSVELKTTWYNGWVRAQALKAVGRTEDAVKQAKAALKMAKAAERPNAFYIGRIEQALADWE